MIPLAIYIHIPFCPSKCGYCDFNSYAMQGQIIQETIDAICIEISQSPWKDTPAKTIFFGGGTPTFIPVEGLIKILKTVIEVHPIQKDTEITSEANPGTVDSSKFEAMFQAGFNRISLGVQSFQNHDLVQLGRVHHMTHVIEAVHSAKKAGFKNFNLDLMFALPGQSVKAWEKNLDQALQLSPNHLSLYCLTIEPKTKFHRFYHRGMLDLPHEELQVEMYNLAIEKTRSAGFEQYEISNFAQQGYQCQHNLCYWHGEDYLAYGPGAVGCTSKDSKKIRYTNTKHPTPYCKKVFTGENLWETTEELSLGDQQFEKLMLGIRLNKGFPLAQVSPQGLQKMINKNWVITDESKVYLSDKGRHFCNDVVVALSL